MGTTALERTPARVRVERHRPRRQSSAFWAVPAVAMLAAVSVGIGLVALNRIPSTATLHAQVSALEQQVGTLRGDLRTEARALGRLRAAQRGSGQAIASLQTKWTQTASTAQVNRVSAGVQQVQGCVAEVALAVSGLGLHTTQSRGRLTGAVLTARNGISSACA
jgi:hypothetical protein